MWIKIFWLIDILTISWEFLSHTPNNLSSFVKLLKVKNCDYLLNLKSPFTSYCQICLFKSTFLMLFEYVHLLVNFSYVLDLNIELNFTGLNDGFEMSNWLTVMQRCIQNPIKHLRLRVFRKILKAVNCKPFSQNNHF